MILQELTVEFYKTCCQDLQSKVLGIDLDEILIERAKSIKGNDGNIDFKTIDIITDYEKVENYMKENNIHKFNIVNCFAVLMWIHVNYGDEGLKSFLKKISLITDNILIEIQPWKCYKNASRRMKKLKCDEFYYIDKLKLTDPDKDITDILTSSDINFVEKKCHGVTKWGRKLVHFQRRDSCP